MEDMNVGFPKPIGRLKINESFEIALYSKMPNRFHRMMARILLGWRYTETEGDKRSRMEGENVRRRH